MANYKRFLFATISCFILSGSVTHLLAGEDTKSLKTAGANVHVHAEDIDNLYAAGARIHVEGEVKENVYLAGALIDVDTRIYGNLYAAGSKVRVKGTISGKARMAAADLKIDAEIEGALKAAAASVEVSENTTLANDSSLAAAVIEFRGSARDNLNLYADEVLFSGMTSGSVTIEGHYIQIDETARIEGDLIIRSSTNADISPDATIVGTLTQTGLEDSKLFKGHDDDSNSQGLFLLFSASIFLLGILLVIFARGFVEQSIAMLRTQPGRSLISGLAVFFGLPICIVVAMITVIGIPIGVSVFLLLPFLLILGFTIATLGISDMILNKQSTSKSIGQRLILLIVGVVLLVIVGFIPLLGSIFLFLALLFGLGAALSVLRSSLIDGSVGSIR